tara:strand:- start:1173 stop:1421 length:249 start_codon:yes stop_codon:yes gene_type:complete
MLLKVMDAKYLSGYKIELLFNDGVKGIVDLEDSINGLVFRPLKNIDYFKRFTKNRWTIEWDCNADFAPEYLHELARGKKKKA